MKRTVFCLALSVIVTSSCGDFQQETAEMHSVQKILEEKYKLNDVKMSIKHTDGEAHLSVTLENSPINDSSQSYKEALASSIGQVCAANFHSVKLSDGELVFSEHHNYVIANTTVKMSYDMHIPDTTTNNITSEKQTD